MKRPICFTVLIASPGDVYTQRDVIEKNCAEWNRSNGRKLNVILDFLRWEKDAPISSGISPQEIINEELVKDADILIALFWTKFGSPTKKFESGTLEEIEQFLENERPVIVYFVNKKVNPNEIQTDQFQKIKEFRNKYKDKGVYREVSNNQELTRAFFQDINYNVDKLVKKYNDVDNMISPVGDSKKIASKKNKDDYWYELSISDLISYYLQKENLSDVAYKKGITFIENCNLWKSISSINHTALVEKAKNARYYAFNQKYGKYNYSKDLRSRYNAWHKPIHNILLESYKKFESKKIIGVGANNGSELNEIFPDFKKQKLNLEVLDISSVAINKGKALFKNIIFHEGNMEDTLIHRESYDVYLNLRSIHSSGVDIKSTISECFGILKIGGVAIISVSNGYITPKKPGSKDYFPITGMYDNSTGMFSNNRPFMLANKIRRKLEEYGFKNCAINTGSTEIFVSAIK